MCVCVLTTNTVSVPRTRSIMCVCVCVGVQKFAGENDIYQGDCKQKKGHYMCIFLTCANVLNMRPL